MYKLIKIFEYLWPFLLEELGTRETDTDKTKKRKGMLFGTLIVVFIALNPTENFQKSLDIVKSYLGGKTTIEETEAKPGTPDVIDYLTKELTTKADELGRLRNELEELRTKLKESVSDNQSLRDRMAKLENDIIELKDTIHALEDIRNKEVKERIDRIRQFQKPH